MSTTIRYDIHLLNLCQNAEHTQLSCELKIIKILKCLYTTQSYKELFLGEVITGVEEYDVLEARELIGVES